MTKKRDRFLLSHARAERDAAIAESVLNGAHPQTVADQFDCSRETVRRACIRHGVPRRVHSDAKHAEMAQAVADGELPSAVAARFRVSSETVRRACVTWGVPRSMRGVPARMGTLRIVAELQNSPDSSRVIAMRLGVQTRAVDTTLLRARKAGIEFRGRETNTDTEVDA